MAGRTSCIYAPACVAVLLSLLARTSVSFAPVSCAAGGNSVCQNGTTRADGQKAFEHAGCVDLWPAIPGFNCTVSSAPAEEPPRPRNGTVYRGSVGYDADRYQVYWVNGSVAPGACIHARTTWVDSSSSTPLKVQPQQAGRFALPQFVLCC